MKCPICSERLLPGTNRCRACGYRMTHYTAPAENAPVSRPGRRLGCCVLVLVLPLLLTLLSALFSFAVNVSTGFRTKEHRVVIHESTPVEDPSEEDSAYDAPFFEIPPAASRPAAADEACFVIDDGVLYFKADSWDGNSILSIPDTVDGQTVTSIGSGCFRNCGDLTTIVLPDTVTRICSEAFLGCTKLRGLYLPDGMETIGQDAFSGCTELEAICIPAEVSSIAPGCFDDCASLRYIIYNGSFEQWQALYNDYITPFTAAVCLDGSFFHGTGR